MESPQEKLPIRIVEKTVVLYDPPRKKDGTQLYVPVVMPNKDALVWYLTGFHKATANIAEALEVSPDNENEDEEMITDIRLTNPNGFNLFTIDSTRFNAILPNDKSESTMTDDDIEEFYEHLQNKISVAEESGHAENVDPGTIDLGFFSVECPECNWEKPVTFPSPKDIPDTDVHCKCCGRKLIHYTKVADSLFTYDNGEY